MLVFWFSDNAARCWCAVSCVVHIWLALTLALLTGEGIPMAIYWRRFDHIPRILLMCTVRSDGCYRVCTVITPWVSMELWKSRIGYLVLETLAKDRRPAREIPDRFGFIKIVGLSQRTPAHHRGRGVTCPRELLVASPSVKLVPEVLTA